MSLLKVNSCGSCAAAITRTPSLISSHDGCVPGSVPEGRRDRTTTSWPAPANAVERGCRCRPTPPMTTGGYSHDTIRIFTRLHTSAARVRKMPAAAACRCTDTPARDGKRRSPGQPTRIQGTEQAVGAVPAVGQPLRGVAPARRQRPGDLAGGVRMQMGAVTGVVGGRVLAYHERPVAGDREQRLAQDLVGDVIAGERAVQRRG